MKSRVLLTGATGFVGRNLLPRLVQAGHDVVCGSRDVDRAQRTFPTAQWRRLDVDDVSSMRQALDGCDAAYYLVHSMGQGADYETRERISAQAFAEAAAEASLRRIVYLGGVAPQGVASRHLRSRIRTGEILRRGSVPTVELRASMIIGGGSESWRIVRDLAARLPAMLLPRWLTSRTQPIAIEDVVVALTHALTLADDAVGCYDLPGPETMSAKEILLRVSALRGIRPLVINVPVVTPRLSSYWIRFVTRANAEIAAELVEGLRHDLLASGANYWDHLPEHTCVPFDQAARAAMTDEGTAVTLPGRVVENVVRRIALRIGEPR